MRIDTYTKTILTLIALLLAIVVLRPVFQPPTASAQSAFAGIQFLGGPDNLLAVDTRTGDIWEYKTGDLSNTVVMYWGKLTQIGKPLAGNPSLLQYHRDITQAK